MTDFKSAGISRLSIGIQVIEDIDQIYILYLVYVEDVRFLRNNVLFISSSLIALFQSFNDQDLGRLNRDHNAAEGYLAIENAIRVFPKAFSLDLIFGLPGQTIENWKQQLDIALKFPVYHLSLYELTLERGKQE